ncbi:MAG: hypothetical protein VKK04_18020 [Synechococcales bacterium]|nr:hypothetical protein [Synechococcales bacterium]
MLPTRLQSILTTPVGKLRDRRLLFWFGLSIAVALVYTSMGLREAFSSPYVIHDDVRSHVFWMRRFLDPGLFPNDLIADYFQSVAPAGYTALYRGMAALGIDPVTFNKFLPLPLVLITTVYCFGLSMEIFPVPAAGFIATLLLNQTTWNTHDIPSGTPRAFIYPLFLAFLYYLVRRSLLPCLVTIVLQGLFYPQTVFLSCGMVVLRLVRFERGRLRWSGDRADYIFCGATLAVALAMMLPYALKISEYGPVLTVEEARVLPTLEGDGRKNFFFDDPFKFWFCGERSGMLPYDWCKYERPPQLWASLLLPLLLWRPKRFPRLGSLTPHVAVLPQILVASLGMFFLAHALLFRLHLPSRYTKHSIRMLVALAAGIVLVALLDAALRWAAARSPDTFGGRTLPALGAVGLLGIYIFGYPLLMDRYPNPDYVHAEAPPMYEFFAQQPPDILIASLSEQANNIPSLSRRSVLTSSEIANPYHMGYYRQIQARTYDLMRAQYSPDLAEVQAFITQYGIDFWLVDNVAFSPDYIERNSWLRQIEPYASEAKQTLLSGQKPALAQLMRSCRAFRTGGRTILDAACILDAEGAPG